MGISTFPAASTGNPLPPGASALVFEGFSSKGGITYTTTSLAANSYLVTVDSSAGSPYYVRGQNTETLSFAGAAKGQTIISFTTTETSLAIKPFSGFGNALPNSGSSYIWPLWRKSVELNGVAYMAATIVNSAGSWQAGAIIATTDGVTWSSRITWTSSGNQPQQGIVSNGTGFYLTNAKVSGSGVANAGRVTTNFTTWTNVSLSTGDALWIAGGNGLFIAAQNATTLWVSTNGTSFNTVTVTTSLGSSQPADCVFNPKNNTFCSVGNRPFGFVNSVSISTNGVNWSQQTLPSGSINTGNVQAIAYGDGYFAILQEGSGAAVQERVLSYSTNGTTWTIGTTFTTSQTNNGQDTSINFVDGIFYIQFGTSNYATYNTFSSFVTSPLPGSSWNKDNHVVLSYPAGFIFNAGNSLTAGTKKTQDTSYIATYAMGGKTLN